MRSREAAIGSLLLVALLATPFGFIEGSIIRRRDGTIPRGVSTPPSSAKAAPNGEQKATQTETYPGHVLSFDGAGSGSRSIAKFDVPGETTSQLTVSAWVRIRRHKQHNMLVVSQERSVGFAIFVDSGEKACFGLFRPEGMKTVSSRSLQLPFAWHHIVATYDGNQSLIYVDGLPGDPDPVPGLTFKNLGFTVGGTVDIPGMRLEGSIARVQLWRQARSPAQVAYDMLADWASPQVFTSGLLGSWPISTGKGLVMLDRSPHGRPGSIAGDFGNLPTWERSTIPHFATGHLQAEVDLGKLPQEGLLEVVSLPIGGSLLLWDAFSRKSLGALPRLPWAIVPGRRLVFAPHPEALSRAAASRKPVCSSFMLRYSKDGVSTSHLVELLVGTTKEHLGHYNLNRGCRQSRALHGTTARVPSTAPSRPQFSLILPLLESEGEWSWRGVIDSVLPQASAWELVIAYQENSLTNFLVAVTFNSQGAAAGAEAVAKIRTAALESNASGTVAAIRVPADFSSTAELTNQGAVLARGEWLMPLSHRMRLAPAFLADVAAAISNANGQQPSAIAPWFVDGDADVPLLCLEDGQLPGEGEGEGNPGSGLAGERGCSAECSSSAETLAKAAAAALGMDAGLWPLMLPGGLFPAATWRQVAGWDSGSPPNLHHWDFWLRLQQSPTAPPHSLLRAGELSISSREDGRCSWDGGSEGIPALDSAVALLRLRHRSIFGEETLAEAEDVVGRMGEGALPTVDVELVPPPPAHNISRESVEAPPVRPVPSSIDANQQTRG